MVEEAREFWLVRRVLAAIIAAWTPPRMERLERSRSTSRRSPMNISYSRWVDELFIEHFDVFFNGVDGGVAARLSVVHKPTTFDVAVKVRGEASDK
jgi:hypothetical protein